MRMRSDITTHKENFIRLGSLPPKIITQTLERALFNPTFSYPSIMMSPILWRDDEIRFMNLFIFLRAPLIRLKNDFLIIEWSEISRVSHPPTHPHWHAYYEGRIHLFHCISEVEAGFIVYTPRMREWGKEACFYDYYCNRCWPQWAAGVSRWVKSPIGTCFTLLFPLLTLVDIGTCAGHWWWMTNGQWVVCHWTQKSRYVSVPSNINEYCPSILFEPLWIGSSLPCSWWMLC